MVERYIMDVGWEEPYSVYNVYGESGGAAAMWRPPKPCSSHADPTCARGAFYPSIVLGDFNATRYRLGPIRDWI